MKKIWLSLTVVLIFLILSSSVILASDFIEEEDLNFNISPEKLSEETMIPIDQLAEELDLRVIRLSGGRFFVHYVNTHYILKLGERKIKLRNKTRFLNRAPLEINNHILVPLEFITDFLGFRIIPEGGGLKLPEQDLDEINVSLITEKKVIKNGKVNVYFLLENRGDRMERLNFNSGKKFDILLKTKSGKIVYRWSKDKRFTQAVSKIVIKPGETVSMEADLKLYHLYDGEYYLEGYIDANQGNLWAGQQSILIE